MRYKQKLLGRSSRKTPKKPVCALFVFFLLLLEYVPEYVHSHTWNMYVMAGTPVAIL